MTDNDKRPPSHLEEYIKASIVNEIIPNPISKVQKEYHGTMLELQVVGAVIAGAVGFLVVVCSLVISAAQFVFELGDSAIEFVYKQAKPPIVQAYNAVGDAVGRPAAVNVACKREVELLKGDWDSNKYEIFVSARLVA